MTVPSLTSTGKPAKSGCETFPFGPSAVNRPSLTSTRVPLGTGIGISPIRDMAFSYQTSQSSSPPTRRSRA